MYGISEQRGNSPFPVSALGMGLLPAASWQGLSSCFMLSFPSRSPLRAWTLMSSVKV